MPGVKAPVNAKLAQVPTVQIDHQGTFKYILCKIYEGNNMHDSKLIVRGTADALFHGKNFTNGSTAMHEFHVETVVDRDGETFVHSS